MPEKNYPLYEGIGKTPFILNSTYACEITPTSLHTVFEKEKQFAKNSDKKSFRD